MNQTKKPKKNFKNITCYNCGKKGHTSRFCKLSKKVNELNLDEDTIHQLNQLMVETDSSSSDEIEKGLQIYDLENSSTTISESDGEEDTHFEINVLTKEEEIFLQTFDQITDPETKINYLNNFQNPVSKPTIQTNNPYNISTILGKTKKNRL